MTSPVVKNFCELYQKLNKDNVDQVSDLYSEHTTFIDPMHEVHGLAALKRYFSSLYLNLNSCQFVIEQVIESDNKVCLVWVMSFSHAKIKNGKMIKVPGCSHLEIDQDGKISFHRDYFDVACMIYEHVPILGGAIRYIKRRAAS
ncbi:nuclear transport factor 2 family protein [Motilimonas pumila]|uniref:nuclear transport factor 2 family protein n=1 Tax=Motilimonas pumila TaxID=2303987 RepID=UPI001E4A2288|nr:nuclear transport factor 2 family protein [Motilimonas pumila]